MITLFGSGRNFGLPDGSPFVTKAEVLLKMSGVPYRLGKMSFSKAPKGKIPYIEDDGIVLGDSTLIRFHLEEKYGVVFDEGLSESDKAVSWAFEKMVEEHLYFAIVHARWIDDVEFDKGPRRFFDAVPAVARPFAVSMVRRMVRRQLHGHGMGRHSRDEIARLAIRDLDAVAAFLDGKSWLMGEQPCAADASVWAMVAGALTAHFDNPMRRHGEGLPALVAYRDRGMALWFPNLAGTSG